MNELLVSPDRGTYHPGQPVRIRVLAEGREGGHVRASISHLVTDVARLEAKLDGSGTAFLEWLPPLDSPRGYGVDVEAFGPGDQSRMEGSTGFDVLSHWTQRPRYGFVTDFIKDYSVGEVLDALLPFHLNALQFYDWQYRHDEFIAPISEYEDPLGRKLSLDTVRRLVQEARARGMASMAYAALYAASRDFQRNHLGWALYDVQGQPLEFEGFLGYMDPTPGRPWASHLLEQTDRAIVELGFDGIHLDQYGEPRRAFDASGEEVNLPSAFVGFLAEFKRRRPDKSVTLNAVKNWPMKALATSCEDFYYVELWPDTPTYQDLRRLVTEARRSSHRKPVVVAMYIPANQPANVRLADVVILAGGATRIELGEDARLLANPYFPKHEAPGAELDTALRRYWDVAVRYGDILFDGDPTRGVDFQAEAPEGIWTIPHRTKDWVVLSLVNLRGVGDARWDRQHRPPDPIRDAEIRLRSRRSIARVWWVDPDGPSAKARSLGCKATDGGAVVHVPELSYWGLLLCEVRDRTTA